MKTAIRQASGQQRDSLPNPCPSGARIKHLPDDLPLEKFENHPIPDDATGVRPQGKLPKDWKAPVYGEQ